MQLREQKGQSYDIKCEAISRLRKTSLQLHVVSNIKCVTRFIYPCTGYTGWNFNFFSQVVIKILFCNYYEGLEN